MKLHTFKEDIGVFEGDPSHTDQTIQMLYMLRDQDSKTDGASNLNGWQKEINHLEEYRQLRAMIMNHFVTYFKTSISSNFNMNAETVKFFANINPPGASHTMHQHIGGHYSGAYWLQADKGSGNIVVMNPYPNSYINTFLQPSIEYTEDGYTSFNCIEIKPEANKGLFFNSNLVHYVDVNRSNRDRIGVAFHIYLNE